jgi:hypothetical protein
MLYARRKTMRFRRVATEQMIDIQTLFFKNTSCCSATNMTRCDFLPAIRSSGFKPLSAPLGVCDEQHHP